MSLDTPSTTLFVERLAATINPQHGAQVRLREDGLSDGLGELLAQCWAVSILFGNVGQELHQWPAWSTCTNVLLVTGTNFVNVTLIMLISDSTSKCLHACLFHHLA